MKTIKVEEVKKTGIETVDRLSVEVSPYFKPFIKIGSGLALVGVSIKIVAALFPPLLPIALVSLAPEMITIGLVVAGQASLTENKNPDGGMQKASKLYKVIKLFKKK